VHCLSESQVHPNDDTLVHRTLLTHAVMAHLLLQKIIHVAGIRTDYSQKNKQHTSASRLTPRPVGSHWLAGSGGQNDRT
jgi:hypothetical protein